MIPPLKPGAKLLKVDGPVIQTARLILRPWRSDDIAANTAMLSDPGTARFDKGSVGLNGDRFGHLPDVHNNVDFRIGIDLKNNPSLGVSPKSRQ